MSNNNPANCVPEDAHIVDAPNLSIPSGISFGRMRVLLPAPEAGWVLTCQATSPIKPMAYKFIGSET
ncbi:MAG: hypothetical protein CO189_08490 [candidate division Zixibacteria bacterium CG_4_9_14_3_um_filter_46_8]|nr:MAG: hypothetical protein CO189_08490 [candidate division Zixibacteria bacterium CG_4_9_14_3_um_filter_46_8]